MGKPVTADARREQFRKMAEADAIKASLHRVRVRFDGRYRAACSCSWVGPAHDIRGEAEADGAAHVAG